MRNWLLPENISDLLPAQSARLEAARRAILDLFSVHGYELVIPPLIEHADALLPAKAIGLEGRTFKMTDPMNGRLLGLRTDMTPQIARIDAHLLNRQGVARLCYAGSVVHAQPAGLMSSREPFQLGAELYGSTHEAADLEIIRLLAASLSQIGIEAAQIELGHAGIFRALAEAASLSSEQEEALFFAIQSKNMPAIEAETAQLAAPFNTAFMTLAGLYGEVAVLDSARELLPSLPKITEALASIGSLIAQLGDDISHLRVDLAQLPSDVYHTGLVFSAYAAGWPNAVARGGRYDGMGGRFGRARPATGFSLDCRDLIEMMPALPCKAAILVEAAWAEAAKAAIQALRAQGEVVIIHLPDSAKEEILARCDRQLVQRAGAWTVEPMADSALNS